MAGDVLLRAAGAADATAIAGLHVRAWNSAYRGLMPDDVDAHTLELRVAHDQPAGGRRGLRALRMRAPFG